MMRMIVSLLLLGLIGLPVLAEDVGTGLLYPVSIQMSISEVQSAAERIVSMFAITTSKLLGIDVSPPAVEIRNTPYLAYFDHRLRKIVLPHWSTLDPQPQAFFLDLADTPEEAGALFVALFNEFLVAHEMGHWVQRGLGVVRDRYGSEREANNIAAAFFEAVEGGETRLLNLHSLLDAALEKLVDPTPIGADERRFFNDNYAKLAVQPAAYGYYQFRFILDSIDARDTLDFAALLRQMIAE
ncbi:MAG: hypothetical protein U9Q94_02455 [Candidatus Bipolaricaulota bacterium]|nr:hypothetical protein [Candidatus Bipolaricaulota bacterium]